MLWDEITTVQGWWHAEERCFEAFKAAEQLLKESKGDPGNGFYDYAEETDLAYDDWTYCQHILEMISSLVRGW